MPCQCQWPACHQPVRIAAQTALPEGRERADYFLSTILTAATHALMAHCSIPNACDLVRNGVEVVLAGLTRESLRQTALPLLHLTMMRLDCPDPDRWPPEHPAHAYAKHAGPGAAFICPHGRCLPAITEPNRLADAVASER